MNAKNNFEIGNVAGAEFWPQAMDYAGTTTAVPNEVRRAKVGPATNSNSSTASQNFQSQLDRSLQSIAEPMAACEQLLNETLSTQSSEVVEILKYVATLGGKRLRPALLLLATKASGSITQEAIRLAAVVELVHTATLVHDDILDSAAFRRHKATIHTQWDVPSAILIGDWLFTQAYSLANAGESTLPGRWIAMAAKAVCEGEILQGSSAGNSQISQDKYLQILAGKTGTLCAVSCGLGAWAGGASLERCQQFYQYGMNLGIGFQIYDDWLDIWGDVAKTGKASSVDMRDKKWTLPLLRFRDTANATHKANILSLMEDDQIDTAAIAELLKSSDAQEFTLQMAKNYATRAVSELEFLRGLPEYEMLSHLANAATNRVR